MLKLKHLKHISKKSGLPPEAMFFIGDEDQKPIVTTISLLDYNSEEVHEHTIANIEDLAEFRDKTNVSWVSVTGIHETSIVERIGKVFDIHPLVLEDIVNTSHRPKFEDFDKYFFTILKLPEYNENTEEIEEQQITLLTGENYVVSFLEQPSSIFDSVRNRILTSVWRIRKRGSDYLTYSLIDSIVDNLYKLLHTSGERIEHLEEELMESPTNVTLEEIHHLRKKMMIIQKICWSQREMVYELLQSESALIDEKTLPYFRDVMDHIIQIIDTVETYRDILKELLDFYHSSVSNRMNEVMKVLTIMASIFIPLTLIAGIYGMNFKFMPELEWHYGYFGALGLMVGAGFVLLYLFRRKDWL